MWMFYFSIFTVYEIYGWRNSHFSKRATTWEIPRVVIFLWKMNIMNFLYFKRYFHTNYFFPFSIYFFFILAFSRLKNHWNFLNWELGKILPFSEHISIRTRNDARKCTHPFTYILKTISSICLVPSHFENNKTLWNKGSESFHGFKVSPSLITQYHTIQIRKRKKNNP